MTQGDSGLLEIHLTGISSVALGDFIDNGGLNTVAPAGIAGEPINLGLTSPAADQSAPVTVTVSDLPAGWTLTGATELADGSWTVQISDVGSLAVTTASDFAGASVLHVTETWTQADGTTATLVVNDNVEAYAPGSPIFALSGDDHLTGSSGNDTFVLAGPVGNDTITNFDVAHDQIDLIQFTGFLGFCRRPGPHRKRQRGQRRHHARRRSIHHPRRRRCRLSHRGRLCIRSDANH